MSLRRVCPDVRGKTNGLDGRDVPVEVQYGIQRRRIGVVMTKGRPESYPSAQSLLEAVWCVGRTGERSGSGPPGIRRGLCALARRGTSRAGDEREAELRARYFYQAAGYIAVGRIRDFYQPDDDCVMYCKTLTPLAPA
jgi:hypothetical protein